MDFASMWKNPLLYDQGCAKLFYWYVRALLVCQTLIWNISLPNCITAMNQAPICRSPFGGVCISSQPICSHNGNVVPGRHILIQPYKAGRKLKFCILATARPMELDEGSAAPAADVEEVIVEAGVGWFDWFDPFSRFSRPHTIIGSVSSTQLWLITKLEPSLLLLLLLACSICCMCFSFSILSYIISEAAWSRKVTIILNSCMLILCSSYWYGKCLQCWTKQLSSRDSLPLINNCCLRTWQFCRVLRFISSECLPSDFNYL